MHKVIIFHGVQFLWKISVNHLVWKVFLIGYLVALNIWVNFHNIKLELIHRFEPLPQIVISPKYLVDLLNKWPKKKHHSGWLKWEQDSATSFFISSNVVFGSLHWPPDQNQFGSTVTVVGLYKEWNLKTWFRVYTPKYIGKIPRNI